LACRNRRPRATRLYGVAELYRRHGSGRDPRGERDLQIEPVKGCPADTCRRRAGAGLHLWPRALDPAGNAAGKILARAFPFRRAHAGRAEDRGLITPDCPSFWARPLRACGQPEVSRPGRFEAIAASIGLDSGDRVPLGCIFTVEAAAWLETVTHQRRQRGRAVGPAQLLARGDRARPVRDRDLVDSLAQPADLGRDLGAELEALALQFDPLQKAETEDLVPGRARPQKLAVGRQRSGGAPHRHPLFAGVDLQALADQSVRVSARL
jgi:hypothetical protein